MLHDRGAEPPVSPFLSDDHATDVADVSPFPQSAEADNIALLGSGYELVSLKIGRVKVVFFRFSSINTMSHSVARRITTVFPVIAEMPVFFTDCLVVILRSLTAPAPARGNRVPVFQNHRQS